MNIRYCSNCKSDFIQEEYEDHFCFSGKIINIEYLDSGDIILYLENGMKYTVTQKFLAYVKPYQPKGNNEKTNRRGYSAIKQVL